IAFFTGLFGAVTLAMEFLIDLPLFEVSPSGIGGLITIIVYLFWAAVRFWSVTINVEDAMLAVRWIEEKGGEEDSYTSFQEFKYGDSPAYQKWLNGTPAGRWQTRAELARNDAIARRVDKTTGEVGVEKYEAAMAILEQYEPKTYARVMFHEKFSNDITGILALLPGVKFIADRISSMSKAEKVTALIGVGVLGASIAIIVLAGMSVVAGGLVVLGIGLVVMPFVWIKLKTAAGIFVASFGAVIASTTLQPVIDTSSFFGLILGVLLAGITLFSSVTGLFSGIRLMLDIIGTPRDASKFDVSEADEADMSTEGQKGLESSGVGFRKMRNRMAALAAGSSLLALITHYLPITKPVSLIVTELITDNLTGELISTQTITSQLIIASPIGALLTLGLIVLAVISAGMAFYAWRKNLDTKNIMSAETSTEYAMIPRLKAYGQFVPNDSDKKRMVLDKIGTDGEFLISSQVGRLSPFYQYTVWAHIALHEKLQFLPNPVSELLAYILEPIVGFVMWGIWRLGMDRGPAKPDNIQGG
ncbi:hypothetical protein KAR10_08000, partial [bacterium]|nr:hypothetical protein [bacterium]